MPMSKIVTRLRQMRPFHFAVIAGCIALTVTAFVLALTTAPASGAKAARPLVYSDLVDAMGRRDVETAKVDVERGRVAVGLAGGRKAEIRVPARAEDLPERLTA